MKKCNSNRCVMTRSESKSSLRFCEHSLRCKLGLMWVVCRARCVTSVYTRRLTFRFSPHITASSSSSSSSWNEHTGFPIFRQSIKKAQVNIFLHS